MNKNRTYCEEHNFWQDWKCIYCVHNKMRAHSDSVCSKCRNVCATANMPTYKCSICWNGYWWYCWYLPKVCHNCHDWISCIYCLSIIEIA